MLDNEFVIKELDNLSIAEDNLNANFDNKKLYD
jgi:hypothetical protein